MKSILKKIIVSIAITASPGLSYSNAIFPVWSGEEVQGLVKIIEQLIEIYETVMEQKELMDSFNKLVSGSTASTIAEMLGSNFGLGKDNILENLSSLMQLSDYKDFFNNDSLNANSFKTFDSAKTTIVDNLFSPTTKTNEAEKIRETRKNTYENTLIKAQAVALSHQEKLATLNKEIENLKDTTKKTDGVIDAHLTQCSLLLKLYEASISKLALSATELELRAAATINNKYNANISHPDSKSQTNPNNQIKNGE